MIFTWQKTEWNRVVGRMQKGSLPHAILLSGPAGIGKRHFAEELYKSVLCENRQEDGHACGACKSCLLIKAGTHPDIHPLGLEEESKVIKIDQIRNLSEIISKTSQLGGYRVAIIDTAEKMNANAANSLLKTLEEPGERTLLILISSQPGLLPATIRSRCQKISLSAPDRKTALDWLNQQFSADDTALALALCMGAPIAAQEFIQNKQIDKRADFVSDLQDLIAGKQNPIQVAGKWSKQDPVTLILWLQSWTHDLVRLKSSEHPPIINNIDMISYLKPLAQRLDLRVLFARLGKLEEVGRQLHTQVNTQLLLEETLMSWAS